MNGKLSPRDRQEISAYLDRQLSPQAQQRLEARLRAEPELRSALDDMRRVRALLKSQPMLRLPRNFTLTPEMAGKRQNPAAYPTMRLVAALASVILVVLLVGDLISQRAPAAVPVALEMQLQAEADQTGIETMYLEAAEPAVEVPAPVEEAVEEPAPAEQAIEAPALAEATVPPPQEAGEMESESVPPPEAASGAFLAGTPTPTGTMDAVMKTIPTETDALVLRTAPEETPALEEASQPDATPEETLAARQSQAPAPEIFGMDARTWRGLEILMASIALLAGLAWLILRRRR